MSKITPASLQIHLPAIFLTFLTLCVDHAASQAHHDHEQSILLKMKQHWKSPPSINHWTPSESSHCSWPGITCANGFVTRISLPGKNIAGTIPPFICHLNNLTAIDLNSNSIAGNFPKFLYNCTSLEYLDLSVNHLVGTIPDDVDRLDRLQYLSLGANQFSGDIPKEIGRFPFLRVLSLAQNEFNYGSFPREIGNLSNLEVLDLARNRFMPSPIPESFSGLKKLRKLWMMESNLIGEIPEKIGDMKALDHLDLSINNLSGKIPSSLVRLKNLSKLYLYKNRLAGELPNELPWNLSRLEISNNNFFGEIPSGISSWTNLAVFKASNNLFTGPIPRELTALPSLLILLLDRNQLSGQLPSNITSWKLLTALNLSRNQLSGQIPKAIGLLPGLSDLDLSENEFSGQIPTEIGFLRLISLNLSSNHLTGRIPSGLENGAFDSSFLNNPGLCASKSLFGLEVCGPETGKSSEVSIVGMLKRPWANLLPSELQSLDIATRLQVDPDATRIASRDYGKLVQIKPAAVLRPLSINDIITLLKFSYKSPVPFSIAARGAGHSHAGQAMALDGVVVDMKCLNNYSNGSGIRVSWSPLLGSYYADVGGEQLWIDVLHSTLEYGVAPVSWTDYLYLTVGGTLSNAGIGGQTFHYGPQISNVYEMDVLTGKGEFVTCSKNTNSDLFYAVLGGLGQFGIITRARIALEPASKKVKWLRMLYDDFSAFTTDQEHLISMSGREGIKGMDFVEGSLLVHTHLSPSHNWTSSFFSSSNHSRISSLATKHGPIYCLETAKYYDDHTIDTIDEELQLLLKECSFLPGYIFTKDVSIVDFLNRGQSEELELQSKGLWDVPHPWLNLFVPKSRILDFYSGVFKGIIFEQQKNTTGHVLIYPMNRNKWDDRMSAVIPNEKTFYIVGFLHSSVGNDLEDLENLNKEILQFCKKADIKVKQYLPRYKTKEDWMNHFGSKWKIFQERKAEFDPKMTLSPGQRIFKSV